MSNAYHERAPQGDLLLEGFEFMCTFVILKRPGHLWPVLIAANRDEMLTRPSRPPGRHWSDRPEVRAGLDLESGGSWLGVNDHGLVAAIMNRRGTLGSLPGKRSRGELVLEALDHAEASEAAGALADLDPAAYRPFNLVVADPRSAYWLRHGGDGDIRVHPIAPGLHMLSASELDDVGDPRVAEHFPRFLAAQTPDPDAEDWTAWRDLLASHRPGPDADPETAMTFERSDGFGTRSGALIAIPLYPGYGSGPIWLHAEGRPDEAPFIKVPN
ncbi:NRDE family protein [Thiocapsa bogorovii]|uniref:NRDE family protein n=1 Tax=Thiocapsa bogorovii TaxID=521689 RepID=UPI001E2CFE04|nr:NRDE family protein [Thiocapsa bogorovii]UHD15376.1 NRDE family protein [Thiocapsa bogorovii]